MPGWLIFALVLLVLIGSFLAYARTLQAQVTAGAVAQTVSDQQAAEARAAAEAARVEVERARARIATWDRFIQGVVSERDAWANKCETLHRKNAHAQDLLWREIDHLSRLVSRVPPAELRATFERLKAEQAEVPKGRPTSAPERPEGVDGEPLPPANRPC